MSSIANALDDILFLPHSLPQRKFKTKTSTGTIGNANASPMKLHSMLHDRESKTSTSQLTGTPLIYPIKAFEKTR